MDFRQWVLLMGLNFQDKMNEINSLRSQLEDKEAIIAQLSEHLEPKMGRSTRRRGRPAATGNDVGADPELQKEVDDLKRQVSI